MISFGKRFFADVIKDLEMRNLLGLSRQALNPMTSTLIREKQREAEDRQRRAGVGGGGGKAGSNVTREAEIGAMQP